MGILQYGAEPNIESADPVDLGDRPPVLLQRFGLRLAARKDGTDRIEEPLPSPVLGSVLCVVGLFSALVGGIFLLGFVRK